MPEKLTHRIAWKNPNGRVGYGPPATWEKARRMASDLNRSERFTNRGFCLSYWVEELP